MKIDDLMEELQGLRDLYGNLPIFYELDLGGIFPICEVSMHHNFKSFVLSGKRLQCDPTISKFGEMK